MPGPRRCIARSSSLLRSTRMRRSTKRSPRRASCRCRYSLLAAIIPLVRRWRTSCVSSQRMLRLALSEDPATGLWKSSRDKRPTRSSSFCKNSEGRVMSGEVLVQRTISVDLALELAKASLDEARKRNYNVAIAVTDRSGRLLVQLRTDNAGPHLLDSSRRKAYTAASANTRTSIMAKAIDERSGVPDPHLIYLNDV